MTNFILILNILMLITFILYVIYIAFSVFRYKKKTIYKSEDLIVINEKIEPSYTERLTNKLLIIIGIISSVVFLGTAISVGMNESVFNVYLLILFINIWYMGYIRRQGFMWNDKYVQVGLQVMDWNQIKDYKWIENKRDKNRIILRISKYQSRFHISVDINTKDIEKVEDEFNTRLNN